MTRLSVNVNKVALLRDARDIGSPSVVDLARTCLEGAAARAASEVLRLAGLEPE